MWERNYKEEHCTTQDEMFSWITLLHSMFQLFNNLGGWLDLSFCQKHSAAGPRNNHTCKDCSIEFPCFYSLRHHKQRYHTAEATSSGGTWTCKVLLTQEMTKAWKKSYSQIDSSWLILKYKKGDIACSILLSTTLLLRLSKENWIAFWIN